MYAECRPRANIVAVFTHKNEKKKLLNLKCSKFYFEVFFQLSYEIKSKFLNRYNVSQSKAPNKRSLVQELKNFKLCL